MARGDEFQWIYRCPHCSTEVRAVIAAGDVQITSHRTVEVCPHWRQVHEAFAEVARGPRLWLPPEFTGDRTFEQALTDVRAIAADPDNPIRAKHTSPAGEETTYTADFVALGDSPFEASRFCLRIEGSEALSFELDPASLTGARLWTFDDADFFTLRLEFADGSVVELNEP
jgi:hypothetical protein